MKAKEIRELSTEEMIKKIDQCEEELFNLRFQAKMGQLANPLQLRFIRRDIARINTILNEKNVTADAK
jgi:large subunit ribosomal protein L29